MSDNLFEMVIPSLNREWMQACVDSFSLSVDTPGAILYVDNQHTNRGVAGAWNLGIDSMFARDADWLVICSESVRFGEYGAHDLIRAMKESSGDTMAIEADGGLGWHLIAFRREVFEKVGYFDELFYPAYFEDNDFSYRYQKAYELTEDDYPLWPKVHIDATLLGVAQGLQHVREPIDMQGLQAKYVEKWGGVSPHETYDHPYNNRMLSYRYAERRHVS